MIEIHSFANADVEQFHLFSMAARQMISSLLLQTVKLRYSKTSPGCGTLSRMQKAKLRNIWRIFADNTRRYCNTCLVCQSGEHRLGGGFIYVRWVIGEREAFGCRYGLESFREYILQHPDVTLYCDHHNMLNMWSCSSAKIARWRLCMLQYEPFKIVHVEVHVDSINQLTECEVHELGVVTAFALCSHPCFLVVEVVRLEQSSIRL
jgi:hypothetical protein